MSLVRRKRAKAGRAELEVREMLLWGDLRPEALGRRASLPPQEENHEGTREERIIERSIEPVLALHRVMASRAG